MVVVVVCLSFFVVVVVFPNLKQKAEIIVSAFLVNMIMI